MKKIICSSVFTLLLMSLLCFGASAADVVDSGECGSYGDNVIWELYDDGTLVISGTGDMRNWENSDESPFYFGWMDSIVINNGITSIGDNAFMRCTALKSVCIPNSVRSIGSSAFQMCSSLESIIIPDSVTSIDNNAFGGCSTLKNVKISDGVVSIEAYAFSACDIDNINIPDSVTSIGGYAFLGCSGKNITIGKKVASIGEGAFSRCEMENIIIPDSVTSIGDNAFSECKSLKNLTIGKKVTSIGDYSFEACANLESIVIPNSVVTIGRSAFAYCHKLKNVNFGNKLTSIGNVAFEECGLTTIIIPDSVKSIGRGAFSCNNDTVIKKVTIGKGLNSISEEAFYDCRITELFIPKNITSIGDNSFGECANVNYEGSSAEFNKIKNVNELVNSANKLHYLGESKHTHNYTVKEIKKATFYKGGQIKKCCDCGNIVYESIPSVHFEISEDSYIYDGKKKKPTVLVELENGTVLKEHTDYIVTYSSGRKKVGTYGVTVKLKRKNYEGERTKKFKIYSKTKSLKLNKNEVLLAIGQTATIKANVSPKTASKSVTFKTSNKKIATVSSSGEITAKAKGKTTIIVKTLDGKIKKCQVKVLNVKLKNKSKKLNVGQKFTLALNNSTYEISSFASSNKKVVTVSSKGVVTAKGKGKATITVKLKNGIKLTCKITVTKASLSSKKLTVDRFDSKQLTLKNASGKVTWKSSNSKVAKVTKDGWVTGVKKGTAVITATCGGVKYKCDVTVKNIDAVTVTDFAVVKTSSGGIRPIISIKNNTNKDIKYIYIETFYRNRFNDPVYCEVKGKDYINLKGEYLPANETNVFYSKTVFYNSKVSQIVIGEIKVVFVDNYTETIQCNTGWHDNNYYYQ